MPVSAYHSSNTLGLSASPAMVQYLSDDRSYLPTSSFIMKRKTVGGAQKDVMRYFSIIFSMSAGLNFSKS